MALATVGALLVTVPVTTVKPFRLVDLALVSLRSEPSNSNLLPLVASAVTPLSFRSARKSAP